MREFGDLALGQGRPAAPRIDGEEGDGDLVTAHATVAHAAGERAQRRVPLTLWELVADRFGLPHRLAGREVRERRLGDGQQRRLHGAITHSYWRPVPGCTDGGTTHC